MKNMIAPSNLRVRKYGNRRSLPSNPRMREAMIKCINAFLTKRGHLTMRHFESGKNATFQLWRNIWREGMCRQKRP